MIHHGFDKTINVDADEEEATDTMGESDCHNRGNFFFTVLLQPRWHGTSNPCHIKVLVSSSSPTPTTAKQGAWAKKIMRAICFEVSDIFMLIPSTKEASTRRRWLCSSIWLSLFYICYRIYLWWVHGGYHSKHGDSYVKRGPHKGSDDGDEHDENDVAAWAWMLRFQCLQSFSVWLIDNDEYERLGQ